MCVSMSLGPTKVLEMTRPSPHPLTNIMFGLRNERALELHLNRLKVHVCLLTYTHIFVYDIPVWVLYAVLV